MSFGSSFRWQIYWLICEYHETALGRRHYFQVLCCYKLTLRRTVKIKSVIWRRLAVLLEIMNEIVQSFISGSIFSLITLPKIK
jgi:hypothetical protein